MKMSARVSLSLLLGVMLTSLGCIEGKTTSETAESTTAGVTAEDATPRETIDKKTQKVLNLKEALAHGGVLASTKIEETNPLMQSAAAYRTTVAKVGAMAVKHAIDIRNAQSINDPKPLTHDQFMTEIVKKGQPDGIQFAMLPYYQEYAWDEDGQQLVVVDFPARKEEREKQR
ncbi:hypothetical protein [Novipirellula artificiosorum]|uniref:Lipoprotein n=1 Tax=Novipirellula artificiosorum TaxID=2528016 RepID=A0A5C6DIX8_9BACT|nr:hypothetical protein [Novipirellula artificiosorum]TWU36054.1 hypothetical protein Poly41_38070 [Novipirellula artificiosorum]